MWDEENRIQEIHDNGRTSEYKYNDAGERVIKRTEQGETAYVNQFWTIRNKSVGTKHVFVGETRIASKVVPGSANVDPGDLFGTTLGPWAKQPGNGKKTIQNPHYAGNKMPANLAEDNFVFFYHPDHLGSTEYVTDAAGELYEHVQYFPFGETWVSEHKNTEKLPYLFTSKELDEETELYYFGARYYDPRTSVWQSADPAIEDYLSGQPSDGVYASANFAAYTYAWANPLMLTDPNGAWVIQHGRDRRRTEQTRTALAQFVGKYGVVHAVRHGYDTRFVVTQTKAQRRALLSARRGMAIGYLIAITKDKQVVHLIENVTTSRDPRRPDTKAVRARDDSMKSDYSVAESGGASTETDPKNKKTGAPMMYGNRRMASVSVIDYNILNEKSKRAQQQGDPGYTAGEAVWHEVLLHGTVGLDEGRAMQWENKLLRRNPPRQHDLYE